MKKYLFLFLSLLISGFLFAQDDARIIGEEGNRIIDEPLNLEVLDRTVMRVQYRQSFVKDKKNPANKNEQIMLLDIGKTISKYHNYNEFLGDSLYDAAAAQKKRYNEWFKNAPFVSYRLDIYKNYPSGKLTATWYVLGSYYKCEENKIPLNWKILSDKTDYIAGYACKKAAVAYRGRNYTVWYAPGIPVSDGPWKLYGLPGLILKAVDDTNEISFECTGIEKVGWNCNIYVRKREFPDISISNKELNDLIKKRSEDPASFLQGNPAIQLTKPLKPSVKKPYIPIELE
jgi:GLPGLI family protein